MPRASSADRACRKAIVYESVMHDSAFDSLRNDIKLQCAPELAWIEIVEQGDGVRDLQLRRHVDGTRRRKRDRRALLPSALMFRTGHRDV